MKIVIKRNSEGHAGPTALHRLISRHPGAAAYFLRREAAMQLLAVSPLKDPVDHFLFNSETGTLPRGMTVLQSVPALAHQAMDGIEQMPGAVRPQMPFGLKMKQEVGRGLRGLFHGFRALGLIAMGQATLLRLPLSDNLSRRVNLPEDWA